MDLFTRLFRSKKELSILPHEDFRAGSDWLGVTIYNMLLTLGAGALIWLLLNQIVDRRFLALWLALLTGLAIVRLLYAGYLKVFVPHARDVSRHRRSHAVLTALGGALWGSSLFMVAPSESLAAQSLLFVVLLGVNSVVYTSHLQNPEMQLVFAVPLYMMATAWSIVYAGEIPIALALALPFLMLVNVYLYAVRSHQLAAPYREAVQNALLKRQVELAERSRDHEAVLKRTAESDLNRTMRLFLDGPAVAYRFKMVDEQREIMWLSDNVYQFGYGSDRLLGERWESLVHPDDLAVIVPGACQFSSRQDFADCHKEYRLRCQDGSYRWIYDYMVPVFNKAGNVRFLDGYFLDVTNAHQVQEALSRERERAQVTLQSIGDAVITTDVDGRVQFINRQAEKLTGWRNEEARGVSLEEVLAIRLDENRHWIRDPLTFFHQQRKRRHSDRLVVEHCSRNGVHGLIEFNVSPINRDGEQIGYVAVFRDVTEQEELRQEIEFQARHDDLTGIYNRWEFENRFAALVDEDAPSASQQHVLMFLDLDQFKLVNDTCGHHCGDELLRQLTGRFGACLDNSAILARIGGDEFGVLLENCSTERGLEIAEALRDAATSFKFVWRERSFDVGVSIGVVPVIPPAASIHTLMRLADVACYLAKERGGNSIRLHRAGDRELAQRQREMNWATRLRDSVAADDFSLHYQDIVPIASRGRSPAEADPRKIEILLRLHDDTGKMLTPDHFLAPAERYNLMPELDRWVIREAFAWYQRAGHRENVAMNINLSGLSFGAPGFLQFVEDQLTQFDVPPEMVCFEVTETAAIQNLAEAEKFMNALRSLGCRFALDDFGTGLSSFEYLKVLPVDYVKIDGRFVREILNDRVDRAMVSAINDVGHTMNIQTVAEYVENDEILDELARLNIDFAQGYGIGQPQALDSLSSRVH